MDSRNKLYALALLGLICLSGLGVWAQEPMDEGMAEPPVAEEQPGPDMGMPDEQPMPDENMQEPAPPDQVTPGGEPAPPEAAAPPAPPAPRGVARPHRLTPREPRRQAKTVTRNQENWPEPPTVSTSPTSALPKTGETPSEPISFDFNDVPLSEVVMAIGRMTGQNFDIDPNVANARVTLVTHSQIPPDMAYEVLESVLHTRGFMLVKTLDGLLTKVVPMNELTDKIPLVKGEEPLAPGYDTVQTHIVNVQYADAAELATVLKVVSSKQAVIDAYQRTNTLIITDTADGLRRIFSFLQEIDVPGYDTEMEVFTLEYARADVMAQQIQQVLLGTGQAESATPAAPSQPARTPRTPATPRAQRNQQQRNMPVPGQSVATVVGARDETLRLVPDERLNSLIVIATPSFMERVRDLIAKLDTPTPYEANNLNVYNLLNADAEKVEEALSALVGTGPRQSAGGGPGGGGAAGPSAEVQPFEKKVLVKRYEQTNSLIILASPQDYKLIAEIIKQLDVPVRQVLVEAVIMDVSIQDTFGLGVETAAITGEDTFALTNTSNLSTLANTSLQGAVSAANSLAGFGGLAKGLLDLGAGGGIVAGAYDSIEATINGQKIKIPFVPFLLKALETLTDVDILSQPSLTTQDNMPANIIVGQELPVPTQRPGYSVAPPSTGGGTSGGTGSVAVPSYGLTSYGNGIDREEVGVKMKVTPHINEGDNVTLETEIEVSEATQSNVGINANDLGPTFNKSQIKNNVVVRDGATGVIGGLIKETVGHNRQQAPVLGDMPVLGWLFRSKSDTRKKQNVVVLITPYIVKEASDYDRISKYKMEEFKNANVDVLFEEGFIKKIKKGHQIRTKYRPSNARAERILSEDQDTQAVIGAGAGGGFGRGDIER